MIFFLFIFFNFLILKEKSCLDYIIKIVKESKEHNFLNKNKFSLKKERKNIEIKMATVNNEVDSTSIFNDESAVINDRYKIIETINKGLYGHLYKVQDLNEKNKM